MQRPLEIAARDLELTEPVERQIREKVAGLESYFNRITGCELVVEGAVQHHHRGGPFRVRIRITLPSGELEVNRHAAEDLAVAIRDAFDAARRRLEDHVRELRRQVKGHGGWCHNRSRYRHPRCVTPGTAVALLMTREVVSVSSRTSIEEAARPLLECEVDGLPVIEDGQLVGIITRSDVLQVVAEGATGPRSDSR